MFNTIQRATSANTLFESSFDHTANIPITETYFPALLQACDDDPNDALDIQLTCGICHEQMAFEDEAGPHLRAYVLACMHIFCNACVEKMVAHSKNNKSHYGCPTCRECLHCATCQAPSKKGSLIHMGGEQSIPLLENIFKKYNHRWHCFNCDVETFTLWLHSVVRVSKDCTGIVGQFMRVSIEYEGKVWDDPSSEEYADSRLVKQQPIPRDLEIPIKIIEEGLLKAHGIAGPDDGSTAFKYEICLYELRDEEYGILADGRRLIEKTEQEVREYRVGYRKLMVLDLAFDMRDYWSDENVRERMNERSERAKRSAL
ncbi:hypothetical protein ACKAV7_006761 [Fusarium commune]